MEDDFSLDDLVVDRSITDTWRQDQCARFEQGTNRNVSKGLHCFIKKWLNMLDSGWKTRLNELIDNELEQETLESIIKTFEANKPLVRSAADAAFGFILDLWTRRL